jgi:hypothetical protein
MKTKGLLEMAWNEPEKLLKTNQMELLKVANLAALSLKNTRN